MKANISFRTGIATVNLNDFITVSMDLKNIEQTIMGIDSIIKVIAPEEAFSEEQKQKITRITTLLCKVFAKADGDMIYEFDGSTVTVIHQSAIKFNLLECVELYNIFQQLLLDDVRVEINEDPEIDHKPFDEAYKSFIDFSKQNPKDKY